MKRTTTTLCLLLLMTFTGLLAQEDSIRNRIMQYKESEYKFVNNGRRMLLDLLQQYKMKEADGVKATLLKAFGGNISELFYIGEYIHLLYWTREFDELLNYMKQVDLQEKVSNNVGVSAQTDRLFEKLFQHTVENKDLLIMDLNAAALNEMERDFLLLLLEDMMAPHSSNEWGKTEQSAAINAMANRFLTDHPGSPYDDFVRRNIRFEMEEGDWGGYWDPIGLGAAHNQGNLSKQFSHGPILEMCIDVRYKKISGMLGFGASWHTLKNDLPINQTVWKKEASSNLSFVYLNAGYLAIDSKRWSIYPFAGIGFTGFSAVQKDIDQDEKLKKLHLNSFFTQVGVGFDWKFSSGYTLYGSLSGRVSLRYSYRMPRFNAPPQSMEGAQHIITLSYGIGGRDIRRKM